MYCGRQFRVGLLVGQDGKTVRMEEGDGCYSGWIDYVPGRLVEENILGNIEIRDDLNGMELCLLYGEYRGQGGLSGRLTEEKMRSEVSRWFEVGKVVYDPSGAGGVFVLCGRREGVDVWQSKVSESGFSYIWGIEVGFFCGVEGKEDLVNEVWSNVVEAGWIEMD
jgi:hypothetical protein